MALGISSRRKPRSFYETVKVGATRFEPSVPVIGIGILINTSLQRGELGAFLVVIRLRGFLAQALEPPR